jgi:hypothetical protein
MATVTPDEIATMRVHLADHAEALEALAVIERCDGSLEDAAEYILLDAGAADEVTRGLDPDFLKTLVSRCRAVICSKEFTDEMVNDWARETVRYMIAAVSAHLATSGNLPAALAVPVVMFVLKYQLSKFCAETADPPKLPRP